MPIVLPPSLRKDLHPMEEEVEEFRTMSAELKGQIAALLCADAIRIDLSRPDPHAAFDEQEPLPPSTVAALARLRQPW